MIYNLLAFLAGCFVGSLITFLIFACCLVGDKDD